MTMGRMQLITLLMCLVGVGVAVGQDVPQAGNPHGGIDLDCSLCHSEGSWQPTESIRDFDHATTGFELEGRHAQAHCRDCHHDPRFAFVGTSCADCHADIHKGGLGPDCAQCHTPVGWVDRNEERAAHDATAFPLVGAHNRVDCDACHSDALTGQYVGTPTDCNYCHADTWAATTDPDHEAVGFGQDCLACHSVYASTWGRGDFVHPPNFPLSGGHSALDCMDCHTEGFGGVSADCYSCHQADYESTTNPDHAASSFPLECTVCHTTSAWEPAQYNHDLTGFPLTGAHRSTDCLACHENGYTNTPADCYACHQMEYDNTIDPNHQSAGFPVDCATCHTTTAWEPSTWDHDTIFPIYSGRHRDEWDTCVDCHVVSSNYSVYECIFCHEHNQNDTDNDHSEVDDYQYQSPACLDCHPDGSN